LVVQALDLPFDSFVLLGVEKVRIVLRSCGPPWSARAHAAERAASHAVRDHHLIRWHHAREALRAVKSRDATA
jgi:hypothetical protein